MSACSSSTVSHFLGFPELPKANLISFRCCHDETPGCHYSAIKPFVRILSRSALKSLTRPAISSAVLSACAAACPASCPSAPAGPCGPCSPCGPSGPCSPCGPSGPCGPTRFTSRLQSPFFLNRSPEVVLRYTSPELPISASGSCSPLRKFMPPPPLPPLKISVSQYTLPSGP